MACNPKKWKRTEKHNHGSPYFCDGFYGQYDVHKIVLGQEVVLNMSANTFLIERRFVCAEDRLEASVSFLVLEDKEGNLYLGNNVGD